MTCKKLVLMVLACSLGAQPVMIAMENASLQQSVVTERDLEQIGQNLKGMWHNSFEAGKGILRVFTQCAITGTGLADKMTKFFADHPTTAFVSLTAGCYLYYKWRCAKKRARLNGRDLELSELIRTQIEKWRRPRAA